MFYSRFPSKTFNYRYLKKALKGYQGRCRSEFHKSALLTKDCHKTMQDLQNKIFGVELGDGACYLKVANKGNVGGETKQASSAFVSLLAAKHLYYVTGFTDGVSFARNVSQHESLARSLRSGLVDEFELISGVVYSENGYFERGYFVAVKQNGGNSLPNEEKTLLSLASKLGNDQILKVFLSHNNVDDVNCLKVQRITMNAEMHEQDTRLLVPSCLPLVHPAFMMHGTSSVYHDLQRAYDVLNDSEHFEEIDKLKDICDKYIKKEGDGFSSNFPLMAENPVVVIEGLDATGKTTLTKNLVKVLNATVLKSPPECICHLRSKFDSTTQLVRRAFYTLGNYAFAAMIKEAAKNGIVIVDRFWNSTAAYAIATDVGVGGPECLPPVGHWVYSWPSDLLKPDAVFLLTITDEERRRRLLLRGTVKTDEEIRLERSSPFRLRLEESYKRMNNPPMQLLDASGTEQEVLNNTLEILKSGGYI